MAIILGIDPGSRITGYGVIRAQGQTLQHIASGSIRVAGHEMPERLRRIFNELQSVVAAHTPEQVAIERVFMHVNPASALVLGHARGAAMVAVAEVNLPVAEYTARQVKQAVVGYGAADKVQVQQMVRFLLSLQALPEVDAADALAIAICHANTSSVSAYLTQAEPRRRR